MNHRQLEEAIPLYYFHVAGALEPAEQQEVAQHLEAGCAACQTLLQEYQETASLLPYGLPIAPVPDVLKTQVLSRISRESVSPPIPRVRQAPKRGFLQWLVPEGGLRPAFVLILVCLLAGMTVYVLTLQSQVTEMETQETNLQVAFQEASSDVVLWGSPVFHLSVSVRSRFVDLARSDDWSRHPFQKRHLCQVNRYRYKQT